MRFDGFDWDEGNRQKCQKHGGSIEEVEEALSSIRFVIDNPSRAEKRYRTVGTTHAGRHVFAVFTLRGTRLRAIGVRYMHERGQGL